MSLYQEIIILQKFAPKKTFWVVENVIPYYDYLIEPYIILSRHPFWTNFYIDYRKFETPKKVANYTGMETLWGFNISKYKVENKRKILRNLVNPEIGLYILDQAMNIKDTKQGELFKINE
jgi:DNA (cytosine-5)-methyltransferase 1